MKREEDKNMRLWSISSKYLDTKGLLALWRESLLAKKVLEGNTKGYKNHPQLLRFLKSPDPILYINIYLKLIYDEAKKRSYNFNYNKIDISKIENINIENLKKIKVSKGQVIYELEFLKTKLQKRDFKKYLQLKNVNQDIDINPIFEIIEGEIEKWEKIKMF